MAAGGERRGQELTYRRGDHTAWRDLGDELVLLDLTAKEVYGLNPTGGYLWRAFDGATSLNRLAERLAAGSNPVELPELESFCGELVGLGLLETAEPVADGRSDPGPLPAEPEPPKILWHEPLRQAAGTCAFLPAQSPLCNQVPFS